MKAKIGDICTLKSGTSLKDNVLSETGGIPYIKVSDMNLPGNEKYLVCANSYANEDISSKKLFPKGTILFPKRGGAIGTNKKRIASMVVCADLNTMGVIPSDELRPLYLYYYFQNIDFGTLYNGSSVPQINNTDIAPMEIELLPLDKQDEVISQLEKVDNIISKRKAELIYLDDLIKARFVEMFGDLTINPFEWPIVKISDISTFLKSGLSRKLSDTDIGLPVIRSGNIQSGQFIYGDVKYWHKEDPQGSKTEDYVLNDGDILVNFINSASQIGKTAIFRDVGRDCIYTTNIFRMKLADNCCAYYYNWFAMSDYYHRQLQNIIQPAVNQASFTTANFLKLDIPLPPLELQMQFANFVKQVDKSKLTVLKSLEKMQFLFNSLMQLYFG